jgi:hypothetical protein
MLLKAVLWTDPADAPTAAHFEHVDETSSRPVRSTGSFKAYV